MDKATLRTFSPQVELPNGNNIFKLCKERLTSGSAQSKLSLSDVGSCKHGSPLLHESTLWHCKHDHDRQYETFPHEATCAPTVARNEDVSID